MSCQHNVVVQVAICLFGRCLLILAACRGLLISAACSRGPDCVGAQAVDTLVDQRLHGLSTACTSIDVVAGVVAEHSALPFVPGTHPQAR